MQCVLKLKIHSEGPDWGDKVSVKFITRCSGSAYLFFLVSPLRQMCTHRTHICLPHRSCMPCAAIHYWGPASGYGAPSSWVSALILLFLCEPLCLLKPSAPSLPVVLFSKCPAVVGPCTFPQHLETIFFAPVRGFPDITRCSSTQTHVIHVICLACRQPDAPQAGRSDIYASPVTLAMPSIRSAHCPPGLSPFANFI